MVAPPPPPLVVGVLALQGDFAAHERALRSAGVATRRVRSPGDLADLRGLVLPGGESTTMLRLLEVEGLEQPLGEALGSGLPVFATCAGLILLAREVVDPAQRSFGVLDITVQRNGYGRQVHSGTCPLQGEPGAPPLPEGASGVFIRAPRVLRVGGGVEVLARRDGDPVLLRRGPILGACFHPELEPGHFVLSMFLDILGHSLPSPSRQTTNQTP